MRILLRDFRTGLYVGRGREWTGNPETARTFSNRFQANAYKVCHCLPAATLVAAPTGPGTKLIPVFPPQGNASDEIGIAPRSLVRARIELGEGNGLFIRGEGEGLNWREGQTMARLDSTTWMWLVQPAKEPVLFQLLLNDLIWARGDNVLLEPGATIDLIPDFEWPEIPRVP